MQPRTRLGFQLHPPSLVFSGKGKKSEKEPPHASCARLLCEKVNGDVVGLAPLVKLQQLNLYWTK
eukprot:3975153-Amphidinium_carterae.1